MPGPPTKRKRREEDDGDDGEDERKIGKETTEETTTTKSSTASAVAVVQVNGGHHDPDGDTSAKKKAGAEAEKHWDTIVSKSYDRASPKAREELAKSLFTRLWTSEENGPQKNENEKRNDGDKNNQTQDTNAAQQITDAFCQSITTRTKRNEILGAHKGWSLTVDGDEIASIRGNMNEWTIYVSEDDGGHPVLCDMAYRDDPPPTLKLVSAVSEERLLYEGTSRPLDDDGEEYVITLELAVEEQDDQDEEGNDNDNDNGEKTVSGYLFIRTKREPDDDADYDNEDDPVVNPFEAEDIVLMPDDDNDNDEEGEDEDDDDDEVQIIEQDDNNKAKKSTPAATANKTTNKSQRTRNEILNTHNGWSLTVEGDGIASIRGNMNEWSIHVTEEDHPILADLTYREGPAPALKLKSKPSDERLQYEGESNAVGDGEDYLISLEITVEEDETVSGCLYVRTKRDPAPDADYDNEEDPAVNPLEVEDLILLPEDDDDDDDDDDGGGGGNDDDDDDDDQEEEEDDDPGDDDNDDDGNDEPGDDDGGDDGDDGDDDEEEEDDDDDPDQYDDADEEEED